MGLKETRDGKGTIILFDLLNIVPFVRKHKVSPVDGTPLSLKDLIRVHFHRNAEGLFLFLFIFLFIFTFAYKGKNKTKHPLLIFSLFS